MIKKFLRNIIDLILYNLYFIFNIYNRINKNFRGAWGYYLRLNHYESLNNNFCSITNFFSYNPLKINKPVIIEGVTKENAYLGNDSQTDFFKLDHIILKKNRILLSPHSIITHDNKLLFELCCCYGNNPKRHWIFKTFFIPKPKHLKGKSLLLSGRSNYWHFLIDDFSKLLLLKENGVDFQSFDNFISEKPKYAFQKTLYEKVSINTSKFASLEESKHFACDELHILYPPISFTSNPYLFKYIADGVKGLLRAPKSLNFKRIYISRNKGNVRKLTNEDEILPFLKENNINLVVLEELSIYEQVSLFSNVEIVLGLHGAGFTNLIFSKPETRVIEIRNKFHYGEYSGAEPYWKLCSALKLKYYCFLCDKSKNIISNYRGRIEFDSDLTVNIKDFKNFCSKIF